MGGREEGRGGEKHRLCKRVRASIHMRVRAHMHVCWTCVRACMCMCMHTCARASKCMNIGAHAHARVCARGMCMHEHTRACVHVGWG